VTLKAMSSLCRDLFGDVGLVSGRVRQGRLSVGMCSSKLGYCRDVSGDVGLLPGYVRRIRLNVGTCSVISG